jgi:cytochrome b
MAERSAVALNAGVINPRASQEAPMSAIDATTPPTHSKVVTTRSGVAVDTGGFSDRPAPAAENMDRAAGAGPEGPKTMKVWDAFVRSFHWLLVAGVVSLVATAQFGQQEIHMALGIAVLALLVARLAWGFVGSAHARFANFAVSPFAALRYVQDIVRGHPRHYLGHNPAGAVMVFALLGLLFALGVTGLVMQATVEFEGPFVDALRWIDDRGVHEIVLAHKLAVNALYLLVPLHLIGVVLASIQHRENLVLSMIHGRKPVPDIGERDHSALQTEFRNTNHKE